MIGLSIFGSISSNAERASRRVKVGAIRKIVSQSMVRSLLLFIHVILFN